jgi:Ca-activated chloride channel family protein
MTLPLLAEPAITPGLFIARAPVSTAIDYKGTVDLTVVPPFEDARVMIRIDGHPVARALRRPYRVTVDLGPTVVEHRVEVVSSSVDGKRSKRWETVINPGSHPLTVKIRPRNAEQRLFEAVVTFPRDDKVTSVEFYDDRGVLARLTSPPYTIQVPEHSLAGVITATAKAASGAEATDMFAGDSSIHSESYDVRTVQLLVSVSDRNGGRHSNLHSSSFEVLDKGTKARIIEVGRADEQPISVALLLDASASMTYELDNVGQAATQFVRNLIRPQDRCAVFAIRTVPKREQPLTSDKPTIEKALRSLEPSGQTAIYDGIRTALRELEGLSDRRAIVILSDGADTSSVSSYDDVLQQAKVAGIPVYFIAFNDTTDFSDERDRLRFLATETGGFLVSATSKDLQSRYRDIERELREQYAIRYQVTDLSRPNEWRDVKVLVKLQDAVARTISGYFTP